MTYFCIAAAGSMPVVWIILFQYERGYLKAHFAMKGIFRLLYPAAFWISRHIPGQKGKKRMGLSSLYPDGNTAFFHEEQKLKNISYAMVIFFVTNMAALLLCLGGERTGRLQDGYMLPRNAPGEGSSSVILEADINGERQEISVIVGERRLETEDFERLQETCRSYIDSHMLGENTDEEHIVYPLNFFSQVPGTSVTVTWETSDYLIIGMDGTVKNEELKDPAAVTVTARCTYFDQSWTWERSLVVCPAVKESREQIKDQLYEALTVEEEKTKSQEYLTLPRTVGESHVSWSEKAGTGPGFLIFMGIGVIILIFAREGEGMIRAQKKRSEELTLDYPVFVHKVVLLLGSGMTCKSAWFRIISDYNKKLEKGGKRQYLYEEMIVAANEMNQGITEMQAYENFGRRCGLGPYLKFCSILIQSVKTGARGMGRMLADAGDEAALLRLESAKRMGEEAGTKLLFPMVALLGIVMVIVMVPAFMSMNI